MAKRFRISILLMVLLVLVAACGGESGRYISFHDSLDDTTFLNDQVISLKSDLILGAKRQLVQDAEKSGNNFVLLSSQAPFGLNLTLPNVRMDERVLVQIKYSGPGKVVIVAQHDDANYYYRKMESRELAGDEWKDLSLEVIIPHLMKGQDLKLYIWNPGQEDVFVDNFSLVYQKEQVFPEFDPMETLHLYIDSLDMLALQRKRELAFEEGILVTADDDYVNGLMFYKDSTLPVELRLKGDWLDHLEGRKWSFRIKVKSGYTWHRLYTFSIHNPLARDFINEWVAHELYRASGNLAPRYGFVPVTLNGKSLGVYAWEEHFEKQLVESMSRREGPIVKFSEDHFWTVQQVLAKEKFGLAYPFLEAAYISPFKESRTFADSVLEAQFLLASDLMYQYQYGLSPLKELFDIEHFAAFHALMDITRGFHGLTWHNQRFYYNPFLNLLEPIFFDGYTELGVFGRDRPVIAGWINLDDRPKGFDDLNWISIYRDKDFLKLFLEKMEEFSDEDWIRTFLSSRENTIKVYEKMIQKEYPDYKFDSEFILNNAKAVKSALPAFREYIQKNPDFADFDYETVRNRPYARDYHPDVLSSYINAYTLDSTDAGVRIEIHNFIPRPISVIAYGNNPRRQEWGLSKPLKLDELTRFYPDIDTIVTESSIQWLFCADDSANQLFPVQVKPFRAPVERSPSIELRNSFGLELPEGVSQNGKSIIFKKGIHQVSDPIIIPDGYKVEFEAGCELDMVDHSMFISYSSIFMKGDSADPVIIKSSDHSANGFTIIQARDTSYLNHVTFEGLNTLNYEGWSLTGAVSFYESHVVIDSSEFIQNQCEDALNIIRSHFKVRQTVFQNTFADAFDSDFCTGIVSGVSFFEIGNDAIDFSGSKVEITDCNIFGAGDKGVSCGENSELEVSNTSVNGANIGFASKDLSSLTLIDCVGVNLNYGLVAFQKKPEFGPASIWTRRFKATSVTTLHLVERASVLKLNASLIKGQEESVAIRFY
ncbi:MAG: CotH kinase family protein [Bacteroidota bacterium]|nr:CotH kinase family protein [Bacteroidota bacterium]